jgi:hypothetical protein
MAKKSFSQEQTIKMLHEAEAYLNHSVPVVEVCWKLGIPEPPAMINAARARDPYYEIFVSVIRWEKV